jgi:hypothetical protein
MWYGIEKSARPHDNAANLATFLALDVTPWPSSRKTARKQATSAPAWNGPEHQLVPTTS